ncbi:MAG: toll/interleukin-1 receptor domain-containing protein [Nannocystis sp.]|nr:toll/interleukin-1 receptor domain-containing protein [Nannocystis sp.]
MSLSIFVSHSFDHSDKLLGVLRFIRNRGIRHVDHSIPAWDPYNGPDVQAEIERRIRRCHRVIVVLTKGSIEAPGYGPRSSGRGGIASRSSPSGPKARPASRSPRWSPSRRHI